MECNDQGLHSEMNSENEILNMHYNENVSTEKYCSHSYVCIKILVKVSVNKGRAIKQRNIYILSEGCNMYMYMYIQNDPIAVTVLSLRSWS